jgi:putative transposase
VIETLDRVCAKVGYPKTIRGDQGRESVSRDLELWAYRHGVTLDFSRPRKPTDNAFIEAFNGRLRAKRLSAHWFLSLGPRAGKAGGLAQALQRGAAPGAIGYKVAIALMNGDGPSGRPSPRSPETPRAIQEMDSVQCKATCKSALWQKKGARSRPLALAALTAP